MPQIFRKYSKLKCSLFMSAGAFLDYSPLKVGLNAANLF